MKKKIILIGISALVLITGGIIAADHIDSPAVTNQPSDITDVYVFRAQDQNNLVFVANTQGLLAPSATAAAKFDENTLLEFNVDNNNDNIEDLVVQCIVKNKKMKVYGPFKPKLPGTRSIIEENEFSVQTDVTDYGQAEKFGFQKGIRVFAGPRDDPFFFDLTQFRKIIGGEATAFNNPGSDAFAGTNVLSVIVEMPKSMLGGTGTLNVWLETKKKMNN
jgi:hypothetical protein